MTDDQVERRVRIRLLAILPVELDRIHQVFGVNARGHAVTVIAVLATNRGHSIASVRV